MLIFALCVVPVSSAAGARRVDRFRLGDRHKVDRGAANWRVATAAHQSLSTNLFMLTSDRFPDRPWGRSWVLELSRRAMAGAVLQVCADIIWLCDDYDRRRILAMPMAQISIKETVPGSGTALA